MPHPRPPGKLPSDLIPDASLKSFKEAYMTEAPIGSTGSAGPDQWVPDIDLLYDLEIERKIERRSEAIADAKRCRREFKNRQKLNGGQGQPDTLNGGDPDARVSEEPGLEPEHASQGIP